MKIIQLKELQEEKTAIEEKERKSRKDNDRLKEIEAEMKPLQTFLDEAKKQREAIKAEIRMQVDI